MFPWMIKKSYLKEVPINRAQIRHAVKMINLPLNKKLLSLKILLDPVIKDPVEVMIKNKSTDSKSK
jgi:hypothetical protein